ncbi:probable protein S-acyltransferase 7 [Mercurialis annua]|uniref:probable protein S-acyltransferase 7 n=1 Tax=Mercurialis annua TaxID=3986 RepID=UPI00215FD5BA|nr:probable protein S-acyltransferase 7 [Mercurialis annua]
MNRGNGGGETNTYTTHRPQQTHLSDSNHRMISTHHSDLRVYQTWKGSNIFCCGGTLIFGPDVSSLFLTVFLILAPVVLFSAFVSRDIIKYFHPCLARTLILICPVFTLYVMVLLFLTSSCDPGIIPRNLQPPDDDGSGISTDWGGILGNGPSIPPTKDVVVNGMIIKVKYCQTCMLYRPPRCSHCSICNNCVERFDHHCPWVGQCIGKRNYRLFFMFVSSTTMLCLYVFSICWVNVTRIMNVYNCDLWRAFLKSPFSGILILYTFICAWFVGGLTAFHLYLICTNQTTYENFRYRYDKKTNPHNRGCVRNMVQIFCSKTPKSSNRFRERVKVESPLVFASSMSFGHSMSPKLPNAGFDIEVGKRQAVGGEDFEEIQSHIADVGGTQPRRTTTDRIANRDITSEIRMLA